MDFEKTKKNEIIPTISEKSGEVENELRKENEMKKIICEYIFSKVAYYWRADGAEYRDGRLTYTKPTRYQDIFESGLKEKDFKETSLNKTAERVMDERLLNFKQTGDMGVFFYVGKGCGMGGHPEADSGIVFKDKVYQTGQSFYEFLCGFTAEEIKMINIQFNHLAYDKKEVAVISLKMTDREVNIFFETKEGELIEIGYDYPNNCTSGRKSLEESLAHAL